MCVPASGTGDAVLSSGLASSSNISLFEVVIEGESSGSLLTRIIEWAGVEFNLEGDGALGGDLKHNHKSVIRASILRSLIENTT